MSFVDSLFQFSCPLTSDTTTCSMSFGSTIELISVGCKLHWVGSVLRHDRRHSYQCFRVYPLKTPSVTTMLDTGTRRGTEIDRILRSTSYKTES